MPEVRILIPTYNRAVALTAALDSVRQQTFDDYEVVIVDDGSSDNTLEMLEPIAAADRRVRVIAASHAGVASARNQGIAAPGYYRYLAFLDSDDVWTSGHLESMVRLLEAEPTVSLAFGAFETVDTTGTWTAKELEMRRQRVNRPIELAAKQVAPDQYVLDPARTLSAFVRSWMCPLTSTVVVRADRVHRDNWFDASFVVVEDVEFFLHLALSGSPWAFVASLQCAARFAGDNLTRAQNHSSAQTLASQQSTLRYCEQKLRVTGGADRAYVWRELGLNAYLVGQCLADQRNRAGARAAYLQSLLASPSVRALRGLLAVSLPAGAVKTVRRSRAHRREPSA